MIASLGWTTRERKFEIVEGMLREWAPDSNEKVRLITEDEVFDFGARLIDVKSGDILLSLSVSQGTLSAKPLKQEIYVSQGYAAKPTRFNPATEELRQETVRQVLETVMRHLKRTERSAPTQGNDTATQPEVQ